MVRPKSLERGKVKRGAEKSDSQTPDMVALLNAVTQLTSQQELHLLNQTLVTVIGQLFGTRSVSLYTLDNESGALRIRALTAHAGDNRHDGDQLDLEHLPLFRRCLDTRKPAVDHAQNSGEMRIVYPITQDTAVTGFMEMVVTDLRADHQYIVNQFLQIYCNQLRLLSRQHRDALTGLFNRRALDSWFARHLNAKIPAIRRLGDASPLGCFVIFDIDHFKRVNDTLGHLYGDEVLLTFTDLMLESFRSEDLLFRYGGEEFVAILKDTDLETALHVIDRFRALVAKHRFPQINKVTVSAGLTRIFATQQPAQVLALADKALYYAKNNGRNQIQAAEHLSEEETSQVSIPKPKIKKGASPEIQRRSTLS